MKQALFEELSLIRQIQEKKKIDAEELYPINFNRELNSQLFELYISLVEIDEMNKIF